MPARVTPNKNCGRQAVVSRGKRLFPSFGAGGLACSVREQDEFVRQVGGWCGRRRMWVQSHPIRDYFEYRSLLARCGGLWKTWKRACCGFVRSTPAFLVVEDARNAAKLFLVGSGAVWIEPVDRGPIFFGVAIKVNQVAAITVLPCNTSGIDQAVEGGLRGFTTNLVTSPKIPSTWRHSKIKHMFLQPPGERT
jgi:hypothetical protein